MTDAERRMWGRLRAHRFQGLAFRRQAPIGRYVVDFLCPAARLIIEIDGGQHASAEARRDAVRDAWLRSQGFTMLRFWNNDVLRNTDGVLEAIAQAIDTSPVSLKGLGGAPCSTSPLAGEVGARSAPGGGSVTNDSSLATPLPDPPPQGGRERA